MGNLLNLSKSCGESFKLLNMIRDIKLNIVNDRSKENKSSFSEIMSNKGLVLSRQKVLIFDFLKFLRDNDLVSKNFRKLSLNKDCFLKRVGNDAFVSDLKSLVKKMDIFLDFKELKSLKKSLFFDFGFSTKDASSQIENLFWDIDALLDKSNSFFNSNVFSDLFCNYEQIDLKNSKNNRDIISIDVENFRMNDIYRKTFASGFDFKVIDGQNFANKYNTKEMSCNYFTELFKEFADYNTKNSKEIDNIYFASNLISDWDLNINRDIVNKAKVVLKSNNTGDIKLILRPREFGSIRINLNLDSNNNLQGKIIVDNQSVKMFFDQNMYSLNKMFNDSGFNANLNLSLAGENFHSSFLKDNTERQNFDLNFDEILKTEEEIGILDNLEKSINLII